ncbi:MAG: type II toxin-antitoxin system YafQ family toxin [Cellvibrionaceae bacterium]|nr:type II toxin-antitoxin system YafQ family toxin [Cellvibrionaceae bacterium]
MYELFASNQFKRDLKKSKHQRRRLQKLETIINRLTAGEPLPPNNRDHKLSGHYTHHRECHVEPDWLLIYRINDDEKLIELVRLGSHSALFD